MLRTTLIKAADSPRLAKVITGGGPGRRLALRFVAGETVDQGLDAVRTLNHAGRSATIDVLGEAVSDAQAARDAARTYLIALEQIGAEGLDCGVSVKVTQMGLAVDGALCGELLEAIASAAGDIGVHVTLDMEDSRLTEATIEAVEALRAAGHDHVGCAVQAYLHRTPADVTRLTATGASLRLCKGAYAEAADVAHQPRPDIDTAYAALADQLLDSGTYPRIATHDDRLISHVQNAVARRGLSRDALEFQMLYGIRTSLQDTLVRDGWRLCVYVPFGDQWYQYFMRRLAERPANVAFFLRALRDT